MIQVLHDAHPCIHRMKALARSMVWWSGIDADLETKVKQCAACQANRNSPPEAPLCTLGSGHPSLGHAFMQTSLVRSWIGFS